MKTNRRKFILSSSAIAFGFLFNKGGWILASSTHFDMQMEDTSAGFNTFTDTDFGDQFPYSLPKLPYDYKALEPFIDEQTMIIHHTKHHKAYVNNLNKALENQSFKNAPLLELFKKVSTLDAAIRNNGGGHYNHTLFWQCIKPNPANEPNLPSKNLEKILEKHFGSYDNFKKEFSEKSLKIFGSGWCWLIKDKDQKLRITTTPNQDNPLMDVAQDQGIPILGLDVWEHAYYLKYQNRRSEYIENFWKIINWSFVEKRINNV